MTKEQAESLASRIRDKFLHVRTVVVVAPLPTVDAPTTYQVILIRGLLKVYIRTMREWHEAYAAFLVLSAPE
jgi:hypothetical protein